MNHVYRRADLMFFYGTPDIRIEGCHIRNRRKHADHSAREEILADNIREHIRQAGRLTNSAQNVSSQSRHVGIPHKKFRLGKLMEILGFP